MIPKLSLYTSVNALFISTLGRLCHNSELQALQYLTNYFEHCQKYGQFAFTLKHKLDLNLNFIIDIIYIEEKPVPHLVEKATRFQARGWLKNVLVQYVWDQLRSCWIVIYLGSPDLLIADASKQFMAKEFKPYATNIGIIFKNSLVKANYSIGMVELYRELQCQV